MITAKRAFREIQFSQQHRPRFPQPCHYGCIELWCEIGQYGKSSHRWHAFGIAQILYCDRYAVQGAAVVPGENLALSRGGRLGGTFGHDRGITVQRIVERRDSIQEQLRQLNWRKLPGFDQARDFSDRRVVNQCSGPFN